MAETATLAPETVAPVVGAVIEIVGLVVSELLTVTVMAVVLVVLPAPSVATAWTVWLPSATVPLFQEYWYGLVVSVLTMAPSILKSTLDNPLPPASSAAVAAKLTVLPLTVWPLVGAVRDTVGAVVSTQLAPVPVGTQVSDKSSTR